MAKRYVLDEIEELEAAIRVVAREADPKTPSREVAVTMYESEPGLIDQFVATWVIDKLATLIRRHRSRPEPDLQLRLGLKKLPRRIVRGAERVKLLDLKLPEVRRVRADVWKRGAPELRDLDRALAIHAKHARERRKITLGQALEIEASKRKL
jgi:hypothetical protein